MSHGHSALKSAPIQGRPDLELRASVKWSGMHWGGARRHSSGYWQRWLVPSDYGQSLCPPDTTGLSSVSGPIGDEAVDSERGLSENCRSGSHLHTGGRQDSVPPEGLCSWGRISVLRSRKNESCLRSFLACVAPALGYPFPCVFINKCRNLISTDFNMI